MEFICVRCFQLLETKEQVWPQMRMSEICPHSPEALCMQVSVPAASLAHS